MPSAHDPRGVPADRQPSKGMGGPIPDFGQYTDFTDTLGLFIEGLLKQIKDWTGIDLFWMLDWSWTTNTILELIRQANDLTAWLQNPIQRPPNLLSRPSFSSPSAIAAAPDWSWDPVISLGTVTGPGGVPRTDPQGSARTTADGSMHSMVSNAISEPSALTPGQILTCQIYALVEDGFTASDDQAIRLELVPSRLGVLQEPLVLASCGVPTGDPGDWIAAPVDAKAVFFDVDYTVPETDSPDTVELRLVVSESAGGDVPVRFDGARVAAAGGFLVVLADLFEAGRVYLTALWDAVTAWLEDVFDADNWTALKTDTDAAFDAFVRRVKRALHHADADIFHPPATSDILSNALRANPWFGWLFDMVDSWLQPVLLIGKAGTAFWETVWHAVTAFAAAPAASGAWSTLMSAINGAWNTFVDAILQAWGSTKTHADFASPGTATTAALKNNEWFGWLFDLVDTWLQPVLRVGKAVTDFGDALWHAVTAYAANPLASGAWPALVNALNDAWNGAVDAILNAWGSSKTHADFASPAEATEKVIKNNPVTGWLFGNTFEGGSWLDNALAPITNFFDSIRKYINQMVEPLHWGYFDSSWVWVAALTTPDTQLPGSDPVMTPGSNDGDGGGLASGADATIPPAPKNVSAIPFWDVTVSGFPAGNITYAIAAVKSGVEGPATQVKTYVGTLFPPNSSTHVDLRWDAVAGASSYRVYRKVDGTYSTTAWRLVASPTSNGTLLAPVVDKTARASGTAAAPKTDAELAAQIVTTVKTTADTAKTNNQALVDTIVQVGTDTTGTGHTTGEVGSTLANWPGEKVSGPETLGMTANLTMSQTLDQLVSGFTAASATDTTPTDVGVAANDLNQRVNLAGTLAVMALKQNYAPVPWRDGGDNTADVTIPVVTATQIRRYANGNAAGVLLTPVLGGPKDQIQIGFIQRPTTLTDVRVALYQLQTDGLWHRIFLTGSSITSLIANNGTTSDNSVATLVTIPLGGTLQTAPGQAYYVEVINKNTTAVNMSLLVANQLVRDSGWHLLSAYARTDAATVTAPTTLAWTPGTYFTDSTLFYATLGYTGGANDVHGDETTAFTTPGSITWTAPDWWRPGVDYVDVVTLGSGASGGTGLTGAGNNGNPSSLVIPSGPGARTVTGTAGVKGASGTTSAANSTGKSPGRRSLNNHLYLGGDPASVSLGFATAGKSPGGGSSGAYFGGLYAFGGGAGGWDQGTFQPNTTTLTGTVGAGGAGINTGVWRSYNGGGGAVWVTARQNRSA